MKITAKSATMLVVDDLMNGPYQLDPVRIITENMGAGRGRIMLVCFDSAWVAFWGAMGEKTVEEFFIAADPGYIVENLISSHHRNGYANYEHLERIVFVAQAALRQRQPRDTEARRQRQVRVDEVNKLIFLISGHGRRFFWNEKDQRVSRIDVDARGKVWWTDSYRGARVCMNKVGGYEHSWKGFSNGGTLMRLAKNMRDYVLGGPCISSYEIGHDCWGYGDAGPLVREKSLNLNCVVPF